MSASFQRAAVWAAAERLADQARSVDDLRWHRLHLIAAARMRAAGRPVPERIVREEQLSALGGATAPQLLAYVRATLPGPLLLLKGPEVAARYPDPALRPFRDLDLLVPDAPAAHARLLAAGFEIIDADEEDDPTLHHRAGLVRPGLPLVVELHGRPKWPAHLAAPPAAGLLAGGRPSLTGVDGVLAPSAAEHAVLLAGHAWAHQPLRRALDLLDIALLAAEADPGEADAVAARWGCARLWHTTERAAAALLAGGPAPWPMWLWARDLRAVRRRSTLADHLARWTAPSADREPGDAARACLAALGRDLRPAPGETWGRKLNRTLTAARHGFVPHADHVRRTGGTVRGWDP